MATIAATKSSKPDSLWTSISANIIQYRHKASSLPTRQGRFSIPWLVHVLSWGNTAEKPNWNSYRTNSVEGSMPWCPKYGDATHLPYLEPFFMWHALPSHSLQIAGSIPLPTSSQTTSAIHHRNPPSASGRTLRRSAGAMKHKVCVSFNPSQYFTKICV